MPSKWKVLAVSQVYITKYMQRHFQEQKEGKNFSIETNSSWWAELVHQEIQRLLLLK